MDFPFYSDNIPYNLIEIIMVSVIIGLVIGLAIAFLFYIFNAIGIYKISKNRGYKNAWLAFIPVVNSYVLGAIGDNINACYNKKSSYRIWLLILNVAAVAVGIVYSVISFGSVFEIMQQSILYSQEPDLNYFSSMFLSSSLMGLLGITFFILSCICWYKIYADYSQNNATLFLVLSILFKISPFFIFAIRNKPSASLYFANQRANQAQQQQYQAQPQPQYQPVQPVSEPVVNPIVEPVAQPEPVAVDENKTDSENNQ